jgi:UDP-3-O-[3-hydroxymyristoyl] glucosamine N-acyltransferase
MTTAAGFTLGELAAALGVTLEGDPARRVTGVATLESAGPEHIAFLTDLRHRDAARVSRAGAFLAPKDAGALPAPVLRCATPQHALIDLLTLLHPPQRPPAGIDGTAVVASDASVDRTAFVAAFVVIEPGAVIGADVQLHAGVYVGPGAEIGEGSVLHPRVIVRDGVHLGRRVIVHAGAVIGADGFGYTPGPDGHRKVPQVGSVRVEDDVEIGANTTIDRATVGDTVIGRGTKIDNLVQIAHNVRIGEHSIVVAQAGISGSSRLGRAVVLAGQVGVADHVTIGDGVMVGAQSGVSADLEAGRKYLGTPARALMEAKRVYIAEGRLPELLRRVRDLERRLARLDGVSAEEASRGE